MDPIAFAATEALIGMSVTILLLGLLGAIFYVIGRFERFLSASKSSPTTAEKGTPAPGPAAAPAGISSQIQGIEKQTTVGSLTTLEEDLPFIAAGVYFYLQGSSQKEKGSKKPPEEACREEWKRSARLCSVGLR